MWGAWHGADVKDDTEVLWLRLPQALNVARPCSGSMFWSLVWFVLGWLLGGWALRDWRAALCPALATVLFLLLGSAVPAVRAVSGVLTLQKGQSLLALAVVLAALYTLHYIPSARLRLGLSRLLVPLAFGFCWG